MAPKAPMIPRKENAPLVRQPALLPKQIFVEGDTFRPATSDPVEQPQDVGALFDQGNNLLKQGAAQGDFSQIQQGTRIQAGVAGAVSGADPMRPIKERVPYSDLIPAAYAEVQKHLPTLMYEHKAALGRLDLTRLGQDVAGLQHAGEMRQIHTSSASQMDTLMRHYEGEAGPTLGQVFNICRPTILGHADLVKQLPNLTKLAAGTGIDAAESRAQGEKIRAKDAAAAAAEHVPAPATAPAGTTTTVVSPGTVVSPPPVTAPAPAPAPRTPRPRNKG